jgi:hypothetical protein
MYRGREGIISMHSKKRYITLAECQNYLDAMDLSIDKVVVSTIFYESKLFVVDTI